MVDSDRMQSDRMQSDIMQGDRAQGLFFSRAITAPIGKKLFAARGVVSIVAAAAVYAVVGLSFCAPALAKEPSEGSHNQDDECPPETKRQMNNCDDVRKAAYALALKRGYANSNGNSIPDVMERNYRVGWNDCSTGNAHVACMFNDPCTSDQGTLEGMRSNSAWHATTMFKGKNGKSFECDFTPQSSGIMIANRSDTRIGQAFPDAGESMDPQYKNDQCPMNGATTALNPGGIFGGGGGGGSMQDMMMMMALMNLFNGQQNGNGSQPAIDEQSATDEVLVPTPTPTPTPTAVVAKSTERSATNSSTMIADAGIVAPVVSDSSSTDLPVKNTSGIDGGSQVAAGGDELPTAAWEEKRGGMF